MKRSSLGSAPFSPEPSPRNSVGLCPIMDIAGGRARVPPGRMPMKTPMNPSEEFLKHAADCQQMAKLTRDPQSKATWNRMAERWLDCAERFKRQSQAVART